MRKILNVGLLLLSIVGIVASVVNLIPYIREEVQSVSLYAELAAIHAAGDDSHTDGIIVTPMATTTVSPSANASAPIAPRLKTRQRHRTRASIFFMGLPPLEIMGHL